MYRTLKWHENLFLNYGLEYYLHQHQLDHKHLLETKDISQIFFILEFLFTLPEAFSTWSSISNCKGNSYLMSTSSVPFEAGVACTSSMSLNFINELE